jgi:hypothetical protein
MKTRIRILIFLIPLTLLIGLSALSLAQSEVVPRLTPTLPPITSTPAGANLTVTYMKFTLDPQQSCFVPGMVLGTQVFFSNTGDTDAESFTLKLTINGQDYTQVIDGLQAGFSAAYWFADSGTSYNPVTAIVDSEDVIAETDENDNTLSQQLPLPTPYISCTPTPGDSTGTPTATSTVSCFSGERCLPTEAPTFTPTDGPTITITPSDVPGTTLSVNGGFEDDTDGDKIPDGWKAKNLIDGKQVCNKINRPGKPDKIVAFEGACAFQFKASGKLTQILKPPFAAEGTKLLLVAFGEVKDLVADSFTFGVKVVYASGETDSITLSFDPTSTVWHSAIEELTLTGDPAKLKLFLTAKANFTGRVRVDDLVMTIQ